MQPTDYRATLARLRRAKQESDRRNYAAKHAIIRALLTERPAEFFVDSAAGPMHGLTHAPTSFRVHVPPEIASLATGKVPKLAAAMGPTRTVTADASPAERHAALHSPTHNRRTPWQYGRPLATKKPIKPPEIKEAKESDMPFKSQAQRGWMHANHPEMAKEWEEHTPKGKKLPKKVKKADAGSLVSRVPDEINLDMSDMKRRLLAALGVASLGGAAGLGAGAGGVLGAAHGVGKGDMARGLGRGIIRGAGTGVGAGLGGMAGGALSAALAPHLGQHAGLASDVLTGLGAGAGGMLGYKAPASLGLIDEEEKNAHEKNANWMNMLRKLFTNRLRVPASGLAAMAKQYPKQLGKATPPTTGVMELFRQSSKLPAKGPLPPAAQLAASFGKGPGTQGITPAQVSSQLSKIRPLRGVTAKIQGDPMSPDAYLAAAFGKKAAVATRLNNFLDHLAARLPLQKSAGVRRIQSEFAKSGSLLDAIGEVLPSLNPVQRVGVVVALAKAASLHEKRAFGGLMRAIPGLMRGASRMMGGAGRAMGGAGRSVGNAMMGGKVNTGLYNAANAAVNTAGKAPGAFATGLGKGTVPGRAMAAAGRYFPAALGATGLYGGLQASGAMPSIQNFMQTTGQSLSGLFGGGQRPPQAQPMPQAQTPLGAGSGING